MQNLLKKLKTGKSIALIVLILFSLTIRIIPILGNNFFFTIDQARDSVFVREIIERRQLIKKGPETSIPGIYAGPGWFYFLALGYLFSFGHPVGGVILMIILSIICTLTLILFSQKFLSFNKSLLLGLLLQIFWPFYDTSRYAFNPFPTVLLTLTLFIFLIKFLEGSKKYYYYSLIPIALVFNADLASAAVLAIFFASVGLYGVYRKNLNLKNYLVSTFLLPGILSIFVAKQAYGVFKNSAQLDNAKGIFSGTNFSAMFFNFLEILKVSIIPQSLILSLIILFIVGFIFYKQKEKNKTLSLYLLMTLFLFVLSYLFFSTNKGWRDWHTIFLPTLIFSSVLMMILSLKRNISALLILIITISQLLVFVPRYIQYLKVSDDPSIFATQLDVLDWIYSKNEENGFNVYTYQTQSYFDYPYQYLFWWYGKGKYKHVPCHYEVYPKSHKYIYTPGGEFNYNTPTLGCDKLIFLIKEPVKDQSRYDDWVKNYDDTKLIENTQVGQITVEKRQYIR